MLSSHEQSAETPSPATPPELRKGAMLALVIGWNIPIVASFYFLFTGEISDRTSNLILACWSATIPFFVLLFAYSTVVQRLMFTQPIDKSKRGAVWVLAEFGGVLSGFGLYSTLTGG